MGYLLALPHADIVSRMILVISHLRQKVVERLGDLEPEFRTPCDENDDVHFQQSIGSGLIHSSQMAAARPTAVPMPEPNNHDRFGFQGATCSSGDENNVKLDFDVLAEEFGSTFDFSMIDWSNMDDLFDTGGN